MFVQEMTGQLDFCRESMGHAVILCACYAVMCFGGRWIMKDRKPFNLQMYVACRNCRQTMCAERASET